jgi:hypothetical protein
VITCLGHCMPAEIERVEYETGGEQARTGFNEANLSY